MEQKIETSLVYWGYTRGYRDTGKEDGNFFSILGGIMEKKLETTIVYWGYIRGYRDTEKNMETSLVYWGYIMGYRDNGKEMETSLVYWGYIRGYRDQGKENGKEDGNYYAFSGRSCFHDGHGSRLAEVLSTAAQDGSLQEPRVPRVAARAKIHSRRQTWKPNKGLIKTTVLLKGTVWVSMLVWGVYGPGCLE